MSGGRIVKPQEAREDAAGRVPRPPIPEDVRVYRDIAEKSPLAIALTRGAEHALLYLNPAFCALTSYAAGEVKGRSVASLFPGASAQAIQALLDRVSQSGVADTAAEQPFFSPDGKVTYLTVIAAPSLDARAHGEELMLQLLDTTEQITQRHRETAQAREAQRANEALVLAALREQELAEQARQQAIQLEALLAKTEKLSAVVENSSDLIGLASPSGKPLYLNDAGRTLLGGALLDDVTKTRLSDFLPLEERTSVPSPIVEELLRTGHWEGELRLRHFGTSEAIPVHASLFGVQDPANAETLGYAVVARDIRERLGHEAEARRRAEFEQQLVGIVSHDLGTPLGTILLSSSLILRNQGLPERERQSVHRIVQAAERAIRMTRDLLDFTKARLGGGIPVNPRPFGLHAFTAHLLEEIQVGHPDRKLELAQDDVGLVEWDEDRFAQVLTNLVNNALSYSPPETPVRVSLSGTPDTAVVEVHNCGSPIPPLLIPKLFEPLHRGSGRSTKRSRSIGLGLYIVKQIVLAHGGDVDVRSTDEEGTTFTARLPRKAARTT